MATALPALAGRTGPAALDVLTALGARTGAVKPAVGDQSKLRAQAVDFESMFLSSMFNQMFTGIGGEGPFGGNGAAGVWRSFLTDAYAKNFAKAGGIGIADHVYRALLAQQEGAPSKRPATANLTEPVR
jgi:peptidoglycan hydrolase FlgJ